MTTRIVSIGEFMLEMSGGSESLYRLGFAGDSLNTAWYMRAALDENWSVDYFTALGDDVYSQQMRAFLEKNEIGTGHIQTIEGKRPGLYLIHQADGDRHFTYWRENSAARKLADDPAKLDAGLRGATLIYFSGITLAILTPKARANLIDALARARKLGARVAFDANIRPALWATNAHIEDAIQRAAPVIDIALPTFDDDAAIFGDASPEETLLRYQGLGIGEVVVKNGALPALACGDEERVEVPALKAHAIDATGAGDSFNGTYLAERLQGKSIEESVKSAHRTAAIVITCPGALVEPSELKKAIGLSGTQKTQDDPR